MTTAKPTERRRKPRPPEAKLTLREAAVVEAAVGRTLGALGVTDLDEYAKRNELLTAALEWFQSKTQSEAKRAEFLGRLGSDVAIDAAKWIARAAVLVIIGAVSFSGTSWLRQFLLTLSGH